MSKVYFANMRATKHSESLVKKLSKLFYKAGFHEMLNPNELVAIKLHFGEEGNTGFIRPIYIRKLVQEIKKTGAKPFLTDANTLYVGTRANSVDHITTALRNGFSYATVEAPIIIADGLTGKSYIEVPIKGKHFDSVKIGAEVMYADAMIAVSHVKGHTVTGFGGAFKNVGMGLGSRSGKQMMHSDLLPNIKEEKCKKCQRCTKWCPADAIIITDEKSIINHEKCIGCGECVVTCRDQAISINWKSESKIVMEKIVEYTLGVVQGREEKIGYINFVMNVTPDCDCCGWSDKPIVPDIGILASKDPVAIDQASIDLINQQEGIKDSALKTNFEPGADKFRGVHPDTDGQHLLKYAEELGMGSRKYELITVD
ncbi:4Fe-4S ferredoxin [Anoxybacter fermentans]|uniref:Ferredoxin n=1 Tax=Anoxybacter fermentans TaxID=1323375 RepID=A0A3Q9HS74_9FIRM|nr:DUF362 domain-containing protein [Anoxybacter fermentans]AZR74409.1 4Fe-4S ferredoxin [Anoxybacter fermentans]